MAEIKKIIILYLTICFRDGKQLFDFLTENYGVINNIFACFDICNTSCAEQSLFIF